MLVMFVVFVERVRVERGTCIDCSYTPQSSVVELGSRALKILAEIDNASGTIFGSECEQPAIAAPRKRSNRRVARLACQHFRAVIEAHEQNESVGVAGGDHSLLGMARHH